MRGLACYLCLRAEAVDGDAWPKDAVAMFDSLFGGQFGWRSGARLGWLAAAGLAWLAALNGCSGAAKSSGSAHPLYVAGARLERAGDYQAAAAQFARCVRLQPGNAAAHVRLGMLYEDWLGDPVTALYHYRQALAAQPHGETAEFAHQAIGRVELEYVAGVLGTTAAEATEAAAPPPEDLEALKEMTRELAEQRQFLLAQLQAKTGEANALRNQVQELQAELAALKAGPTPATLTPAASASNRERLHTVQKGDTLIGIARQHYGSEKYWRRLRDHNQDVLRGGDTLRPGMKIRLPDKRELE